MPQHPKLLSYPDTSFILNLFLNMLLPQYKPLAPQPANFQSQQVRQEPKPEPEPEIMEITRQNWEGTAGRLLQLIADSHFVSFDLELSGISQVGNRRNAPTEARRANGGKQTLQERYDDAREAAEKYQVLQVGITCVEEDPKTGT